MEEEGKQKKLSNNDLTIPLRKRMKKTTLS